MLIVIEEIPCYGGLDRTAKLFKYAPHQARYEFLMMV